MTQTETGEPGAPDGPAEIAGFWRRTGAFLIDLVLLGLTGWVLGLFLADQFEAMGAWGRVIGFIVALVYFGTMESRIYQGQTFGKHLLDIRVVTTAGASLGVGKAMLRTAVFHVPYFLKNADLGANYTHVVLPAVQAMIVFGLGGAIAYLYVFNRRTRQSVHDLVAGAVIVRAGRSAAPRLLPVWKGHVAIAAALPVLALGAVLALYTSLGNGALQPLMLVQHQVSRMPGVRSAGVFEGTSIATGGQRMRFITLTAVTGSGPIDQKKLAYQMAAIAFASYPSAQQLDSFAVVLVRGYDIGIASNWQSTTFNASPAAWREGQVGNE